VIAYNTSTAPIDVHIEVDTNSHRFTALHGSCAPKPDAPGSYHVSLRPLDYVVCAVQDDR